MAYTPVGPFTNNAPPALDETTMDHLEAGIVGAHADLAGKADTSHTHPASDLTATGTRDGTTFLRGDNTWAVPAGGGGAVDSVNGETGVVVLDPDDLDDTSTTNKFATAAQLSKIDGVEAGADVTDTANVTAAGALMDTEVTNLAAVKAFDPAAFATAASVEYGAHRIYWHSGSWHYRGSSGVSARPSNIPAWPAAHVLFVSTTDAAINQFSEMPFTPSVGDQWEPHGSVTPT